MTMRDAFGHVTHRELVVSIDAAKAHDARADKNAPAKKAQDTKPGPHAALSKPSLAAQFASAHAALHVARPQAMSQAMSQAMNQATTLAAGHDAAHDAQRTAPAQPA
jgi:hypothetical protein